MLETRSKQAKKASSLVVSTGLPNEQEVSPYAGPRTLRSKHYTQQVTSPKAPAKTELKRAPHEIQSIVAAGGRIGILLSNSQNMFIEGLLNLTKEKSRNKDDITRDDFMLGNGPALTEQWAGMNHPVPCLETTLKEITRAVVGSNYGGRDLRDTAETLVQIHSLPHPIFYYRTEHQDEGKRVKKTRIAVTVFKPLIEVSTVKEEDANVLQNEFPLFEESAERDSPSEAVKRLHIRKVLESTKLIIKFSPIFVDQIQKHYVQYPQDLRERMLAAYGNHAPSVAKVKPLVDHLMQMLAWKERRSQPFEMKESEVYRCLDLKNQLKTNRGRAEAMLVKYLDGLNRLGIITQWRRFTNRFGEKEIIFSLNLEFYSGEARKREQAITLDAQPSSAR